MERSEWEREEGEGRGGYEVMSMNVKSGLREEDTASWML